MAADAIVFALANPDPEVDPAIARRHAAIVATGRSDEPNQINNVLAFPGIFRGLLDEGATKVTEAVEIAAGRAIAAVVKDSERSPDYIVPTVFNPGVVSAVSAAVAEVVRASRSGAGSPVRGSSGGPGPRSESQCGGGGVVGPREP